MAGQQPPSHRPMHPFDAGVATILLPASDARGALDTLARAGIRAERVELTETVHEAIEAERSETAREIAAVARARGKPLGRPPTAPTLLALAAERVASGATITDAARMVGVSRSALGRHLQRRGARKQ